MKLRTHLVSVRALVVGLAFGTLAALPMDGQTSSAPTAPATPATAQTISVTRKQAIRPPESLRPALSTRPSTAEAGPLHAGWKPIKEMPALQLTSGDGKQVGLSSTGQPRHWLLLYRIANCVACDRLMLALAASASPELKGGKPYVVLVDSPKPDALQTVQQSFTGLSKATWLADRNKQAFAALKPRGSPVLYAMDGNRIAWSVAGGLDDPATVTHITDSWLAFNSTPAAKPATTTAATTTTTSPSATPSAPAKP